MSVSKKNLSNTFGIIVLEDEKNVFINVRDYGPGINSEEAQQVFEPFFRATNSKKISGIGLGLSISKKIMKSHRGNIKLKLDCSPGVEFCLVFPYKG